MHTIQTSVIKPTTKTKIIFLGVALFLAVAFNSTADIITTYAGGGSSTPDGIPATNAILSAPWGVTVDPAGDLYIADGPFVRRVDHATGILTTVAGTGALGTSGDGGPATNALLSSATSVAVDLAGNLFICDMMGGVSGNGSVREVNAQTGVITTVVAGPIIGDGQVKFMQPQGIAVDVHGNLYIADWANSIVLELDAANRTLRTIAGKYAIPGYSGDGGPATNANLGAPTQIAVDVSGNLFILDADTVQRIRRLDGQTGIITTVAGGGAGSGSSGFATNANLNLVGAGAIAVDNLGGLYVGGPSNVWKVDLNSGTISIIAGGATQGFTGDGGPATNALLNIVLGIGVSGAGDIYLSDSGNGRVRRITPDAVPPYAVLVDLTTAPTFLDPMPAVQGRLGVATVNGHYSLVVPNGTNATARLTVSGANGLAILGVTGTTSFSLAGLTSYGGNLTLSGLTGLNSIDLTTITSIGGSLILTGNGSASVFVGSPNVAGTIAIDSNGSGGATVGSPTANTITLTSNGSGGTTVGAATATSVVITSNGSGPITVGSPVANSIDVSSGGSGSVSVGGAAVTGNVTVTGNGTNTTTLTGTSIGGNLSVSLTGGASADVSGAQTAGNVTVTTSGSSTFVAATGGGTTAVAMANGPATLHATLPTNTFTTNVSFSVQAVATTNSAAAGTSPDGSLASVTPVAQYQFSFAISTLNRDASLTFDITLAALDPTNRAAFLAALNSGAATVAVQGDAPGSLWQTFPICGSSQPPSAGGCVSELLLDGAGMPLPPGSTNASAVVSFSGVAGHFSKWGVVLAQPVRVGTALVGGGTLRLTWPGVAAAVLETSTNLAPNSWSSAGTATSVPDGTLRLDVSPTNPARFFRLKSQ
jgi:hypothetical protein